MSQIMNETFSIQFSGKAFDDHDISAAALAQSLLSLDGLAKRAAGTVYGKESNVEVKVKAGFKQGSFIVDLVTYCTAHPVESATIAAAVVTASSGVYKGVVATIKGVIRLGKFVLGKKVKVDPNKVNGDDVTVTNDLGQSDHFNMTVVNIYNQGRTRILLSRLTQTLDLEGADSIRLYTEDDDPSAEVINKQDREFFRHEEGIVLTDNESEVILEVVGAMMNGSGKGWRFSEGGESNDFTANVEDDDFLGKVMSREVKFEHGTAIRAIVRTVQRKNIRTVTEKTIVEVKEIYPPSDDLF